MNGECEECGCMSDDLFKGKCPHCFGAPDLPSTCPEPCGNCGETIRDHATDDLRSCGPGANP